LQAYKECLKYMKNGKQVHTWGLKTCVVRKLPNTRVICAFKSTIASCSTGAMYAHTKCKLYY
jgi:hypothetical protein